MKRLLSILLAYSLVQSQSWALSGGPRFSNDNGVSVIGTFSGVMTGVENSIGIFTIGIPDVGRASGDFEIFVEGNFFNGTIAGVADPKEATLKGTLKASFANTTAASFSDLFFGFNATGATQADGTANGTIDCEIKQRGVGGLLSDTRMEGTAHIDVRERKDEVVPNSSTTATDANGNATTVTTNTTVTTYPLIASLDYVVDGFRQSFEAEGSTALAGFGQ